MRASLHQYKMKMEKKNRSFRLALTLTLSPGEREQRTARSGKLEALACSPKRGCLTHGGLVRWNGVLSQRQSHQIKTPGLAGCIGVRGLNDPAGPGKAQAAQGAGVS